MHKHMSFAATESLIPSSLPGLHSVAFKYFRPLLECAGFSVTDASNIAATSIPLIEEREFKLLQQEFCNEFFGVTFNGMS